MNAMEKEQPGSVEPDVLLTSVLTSVPFGIMVLSPEGMIIHANLIARDLLALSPRPDDITGTKIIDYLQQFPRFEEELSVYFNKPVPVCSFEPGVFNDRYLEITIHQYHNGFVMTVNDVTELKELESSSVQAIISAQEKERRRLAREIHDGIAPLLSTAKLELDLFLEVLKAQDKDIPDERLLNIRNTIDAISVDLRNLSHRLMPRLLEEFGLLSALQNMVNRLDTTTRSRIEFFCNLRPGERAEKEIELNIFRCCQEMMANAIKHADAEKITVQLIKHDKSIVLMVEDDGIGFNPEGLDPEGEGIGLLNIETRARTLNGEFLLESVKGRGTLISIELPV